MSELHDLAARGFSRDVDAYERARPGYPPEAIRFLAEVLGIEPSWTVVDLGAGTGKLTRELLALGTELVAVEPLSEMREKLAGLLPQVEVRAGRAEAIPLPDGSVDVLFSGQAFHWFDPSEALPEVHRVLRPGRHVVLIWNVRDRSVEWVDRVAGIVGGYREAIPSYDAWREPFERSGLFGTVEECTFGHRQELSPERYVEQVASTSAIAVLPDREREAVLEEVRRTLAEHPQTAGRDRLLVPFRTRVHWAERRD